MVGSPLARSEAANPSPLSPSIGGKVNWGLLEFKNKFLSRLYVRDLYSLRFVGRQ